MEKCTSVVNRLDQSKRTVKASFFRLTRKKYQSATIRVVPQIIEELEYSAKKILLRVAIDKS